MVPDVEQPRPFSGRSTAVIAVALGVIAGGISLLRLWLGDRSAITEVLWAEDGLFALCIHKADFLTCTAQPFAGYLLLLPRALAWPVSVLPIEHWALVANLLAALLASGGAALVYVFARRYGLTPFVSIVLGLLPVVAPISGLEAINALGSSYMLLLYVTTLGIMFGQPSRAWWWILAILALITALTIPSAVVLLPLVLVQSLRGRMSGLSAGLVGGMVGIGLVAQAWVAATAQTPRSVVVTADSLSSWANTVPISLLTYSPGLSLGEYSFLSNSALTVRPFAGIGWLVVGVLFVLGLILIMRGWSDANRQVVVGMLVLAGLAFGFIPSAIGDANNRYFVVPVLLWGAALLVALDAVIRRTRWWVTALVVAVVVVVWWPALPASWLRSTPAPPWRLEVERVKAVCVGDPALMESLIFSPYWPPNAGSALDEPTHPNIPCTTVYRWIL